VLDRHYNEVKGSLSVQKGRKRVIDSGFSSLTDSNDTRLNLVTTFLTDAKNNRDPAHGA
jgi:hypothetical protein